MNVLSCSAGLQSAQNIILNILWENSAGLRVSNYNYSYLSYILTNRWNIWLWWWGAQCMPGIFLNATLVRYRRCWGPLCFIFVVFGLTHAVSLVCFHPVNVIATSPSYFRGFTLIALKEGTEGDKDEDYAGNFQVRHCWRCECWFFENKSMRSLFWFGSG